MNSLNFRLNWKRCCTGFILGLLAVAVLIPSLFVTPVSGSDWWDPSWIHRMKITFDNSAISENLTNFPMPIVFDGGESDFWSSVSSDGSDIRFVDSDSSTELYFELEQWDYSGNNMVAWVKVPQVSSESTTDHIFIYYKNDTGVSSTEYKNSTQVWNSNYVAIWHLNQTSGTIYDATSNNNDATNLGAASTTSGKIGNAYDFEFSDNDYMTVADSNSLDITNKLTIEAWVKPEAFGTYWYILEKHGATHDEDAYAFLMNLDDKMCFEADVVTDGYQFWQSDTTNQFTVDNWYLLTVVWDYPSSEVRFYKDGSILDTLSTSVGDLDTTDYGIDVGRQNAQHPSNFDGILDELRISANVHSAEWIEACYQYQVDQSKIQFGSEETSQPAKLSVDPQIMEKSIDDVCTTFQANATIENVADLYAFDFNLTWDNTLITLVDVDFNTSLDNIWGLDGWFVAFNESGTGYYKLAAVSISGGFNTTPPVALATLTFHVEDTQPAETPIHFSTAKLSNSEWQPIPVEAADGLYRLLGPTLYVDPSLVQKDPVDVCTYFNVTVMIKNVTDLYGFDFNITWDSNLIRLVNVEYNGSLDALWGDWMVAKNESGIGWYKLVALSLSSSFNTTNSQPLVILTFHVESFRNWQAETALHFAVAKLSDSNWQPILAIAEDGTYRITGLKPTLRMSPDSVTCRKYCENFTITINVSEVLNVEDFEFEIYYNTTLLDYLNVTWNAWGSGTIDNSTHGILIGNTSGSPATGNLTLATITFHAACHHIWRGNDCQNWTNNLNGTIYFQWANLSYPDIPDLRYEKDGPKEINVDPEEVAYIFSPIKGDVDNDGNVGIFDLRIVAYYYDVESSDPEWAEASAYDLNCDGRIDILDLVTICSNFDYKYDC